MGWGLWLNVTTHLYEADEISPQETQESWAALGWKPVPQNVQIVSAAVGAPLRKRPTAQSSQLSPASVACWPPGHLPQPWLEPSDGSMIEKRPCSQRSHHVESAFSPWPSGQLLQAPPTAEYLPAPQCWQDSAATSATGSLPGWQASHVMPSAEKFPRWQSMQCEEPTKPAAAPGVSTSDGSLPGGHVRQAPPEEKVVRGQIRQPSLCFRRRKNGAVFRARKPRGAAVPLCRFNRCWLDKVSVQQVLARQVLARQVLAPNLC